MKHHTKNIGQRTVDIANGEAKKVWQQTDDYNLWFQIWMETYHSALREFNCT